MSNNESREAGLNLLWTHQGGSPHTAILLIAGDLCLLEEGEGEQLHFIWARHHGPRQNFAAVASAKAHSHGQTADVGTVRAVGSQILSERGKTAVIAVDVVTAGPWIPPGCVWVKLEEVTERSDVARSVKIAAQQLRVQEGVATATA
jgi:hypothetical protein